MDIELLRIERLVAVTGSRDSASWLTRPIGHSDTLQYTRSLGKWRQDSSASSVNEGTKLRTLSAYVYVYIYYMYIY